jgi:hypothetical protein
MNQATKNALAETTALVGFFKTFGSPKCSFDALVESLGVVAGVTRPAIAACIRMGFIMPSCNVNSDECVWELTIQ